MHVLTIPTKIRNGLARLNCDTAVLSTCSLPLLSEVLDGLKVYFDFMLADHLLYSVEKDQHRSLGVLNPVYSNKKTAAALHLVAAQDGLTGSMPSKVYGATHLLRLFVRLPHFLTCAQLPSAHVQVLHTHFKDLLGQVIFFFFFFFAMSYFIACAPTGSYCCGSKTTSETRKIQTPPLQATTRLKPTQFIELLSPNESVKLALSPHVQYSCVQILHH